MATIPTLRRWKFERIRGFLEVRVVDTKAPGVRPAFTTHALYRGHAAETASSNRLTPSHLSSTTRSCCWFIRRRTIGLPRTGITTA
jgi:hypothetical protein